jgi:S1-C subfamily serine protease
MNHKKRIFGLGAVALGALLTTSVLASASSQAPPSLKPVAPPTAAPAPQALGQPATSWRDALTAEDFGERTQAFDQAVAAVRGDATLRAALEEWAANRSLGELAWTAHLILHEAAKAPALPSLFGGADPFGNMIPDLFGDSSGDPFQGLFDGFFQHGMPPQGLAPLPPLTPGTVERQSRSFSLESTPDGVKVRVEKEGPDGTETEEYEAESLEALKAAHPELFQAGGLGLQPMSSGGLRALFPQTLGGGFPGAMPFGTPHGVRTDVLGVMVRTAAAGEAGLLVERVLPGTIAAAVGLEAGDTVVRVAGAPVSSSEEVKAALRDRDDDEGVVVEWLDRDGKPQSGAWAPEL